MLHVLFFSDVLRGILIRFLVMVTLIGSKSLYLYILLVNILWLLSVCKEVVLQDLIGRDSSLWGHAQDLVEQVKEQVVLHPLIPSVVEAFPQNSEQMVEAGAN